MCPSKFIFLTLGLVLTLSACSDSSDRHPPQPPAYDFSAVDARLQQFLDESERYDGISVTLVDELQGTVHEAAFGDHTTDIVVMLASSSKMPAATLLMALDDDEGLNFDVDAPISQFLPWEGVYGDRTGAQLVSNTSGIPGLSSLANLEGDLGNLLLHSCQFFPVGTLEECGQIIYSTELNGTVPPDTTFDYGGSQWQLAGAVAEQVSNSSWRQSFDEYIADPCELEVFQFGNIIGNPQAWSGHPDSLLGLDNPNIEGGAISNLQDYAKILLMHLRGGMCGDNRVIDGESVAFMQIDRGGVHGTPYGMGWWITPAEDGGQPTVFWDPGAFGSIAWLDMERRIGGFVAIDDYSTYTAADPVTLVLGDIIPLVAEAVDAARGE